MGTCTSAPVEYYQPSNMNPIQDIAKGTQTFVIPYVQEDISQPPRKSLQMQSANTSFTSDTYTLSLSNSNSTSSSTSHSSSKIIYSMNTVNLASIVKYIVENEPLFEKYKHKSDEIYNAFINYHIKGKMLRKLSRIEFASELTGIRSIISTKIYIWLKSLCNEEVTTILTNIKQEQFQLEILAEQISQKIINTPTTDTIIELPAYLKQHHRNISNRTSSATQCFEASISTDNYYDINEADFKMCDSKTFQIFVYNLCVIHNYNEIVIEMLLKALMNIGMNGSEFFSLTKIEFCKMLKKYEIKAGIASKLYKHIIENHENIGSYLENNNVCVSFADSQEHENEGDDALVEISVGEFQICAYNMLELMNENMKKNMVNGLILFEHYKSKEALKMFLKENVTSKSVNILADLMWNDYMRDKDKIDRKVVTYTRKQIMKYFIALYHFHVNEVIMKYDLNKNKCVSLNRKQICKIFIDECGFGVGIATNIVDKIYGKMHE